MASLPDKHCDACIHSEVCKMKSDYLAVLKQAFSIDTGKYFRVECGCTEFRSNALVRGGIVDCKGGWRDTYKQPLNKESENNGST